MQKKKKRPRNNGVLEGITFKKLQDYTPALKSRCMKMTARLQQRRPDTTVLFDVKLKNKAQYAYELDPIAQEPNPKDGFAVNGVSAIQYYGTDQLLIVERSHSVGKNSLYDKSLFV
jgi:hypothetical protein